MAAADCLGLDILGGDKSTEFWKRIKRRVRRDKKKRDKRSLQFIKAFVVEALSLARGRGRSKKEMSKELGISWCFVKKCSVLTEEKEERELACKDRGSVSVFEN